VLYTVTDVAKALRASPSAVYEWVSLGKIPYVKVNGLVRFRASEIDRWLEARHGGPDMGRRK